MIKKKKRGVLIEEPGWNERTDKSGIKTNGRWIKWNQVEPEFVENKAAKLLV